MHHFKAKARWIGRLDGNGTLSARGFESVFSAPTSLGGSDIGTNPEELLLSAAAGCFSITLAAVLARMGVAVREIYIDSEMAVEGSGKDLAVKAIHHVPYVRIESNDDKSRVESALQATEGICLISRALKGNVLVSSDAVITTGDIP